METSDVGQMGNPEPASSSFSTIYAETEPDLPNPHFGLKYRRIEPAAELFYERAFRLQGRLIFHI